MRLGDTPVPIPNTMVKTQAADGYGSGMFWREQERNGPTIETDFKTRR